MIKASIRHRLSIRSFQKTDSAGAKTSFYTKTDFNAITRKFTNHYFKGDHEKKMNSLQRLSPAKISSSEFSTQARLR